MVLIRILNIFVTVENTKTLNTNLKLILTHVEKFVAGPEEEFALINVQTFAILGNVSHARKKVILSYASVKNPKCKLSVAIIGFLFNAKKNVQNN